MLKRTIVCVMLVAAAAMAWRRLEDVPSKAQVRKGAHLVWGDSQVWGVFPTEGTHTGTYLFCYDPFQDTINPDSCHWDTMPMMSGAYLDPCNITFQPGDNPTVWGIGATGGISYLKHYFEGDDHWNQEIIDTFALGAGATIAYAPNPNYNPPQDPIPGFVYCLPGGESTYLWRYNVPNKGLLDPGLYGYLYPDTGATVAEQAPRFRWAPTGSQQYRIVVSTTPTFRSYVIDTVVTTNEYTSANRLANGNYYWRVAAWSNGQWDWVTVGYYWFAIAGGWFQLPSIDSTIYAGAEIAYDAGSFQDGQPGILAIYGRTHKRFSRYVIPQNTWQLHVWDNTPHSIYPGSSLTTSALVEGACPYHIDASFLGQQKDDYPWCFRYDTTPEWYQFVLQDDTADWYSGFPADLDSGSSMIIGANHYSYLITGQDHAFYRLEPEAFARGGGQAGVAPSASATTQAITVRDGIEVQYQLAAAAHVRAVLHDAIGRQVGMLDLGAQGAGPHRVSWKRDMAGRKLNAGAYFVLLDLGKEKAMLKAVVR